jgi:hypothetical protein
VPRTGGVILARCASKDALVGIRRHDLFCRNSVATFEVIQFRTNQHDPAISPFAATRRSERRDRADCSMTPASRDR